VVNIGAVLMLEILNGKKERLKCKLLDRMDGKLFIDFPVNEETGKTTFLHNNTELLVTFVNENDQVFRFKTKVIGKFRDNIPMVILKEPKKEEFKQVQRRQFVRVETSIDVAIHPFNHEFDPFCTVTEDISGGGAAILFPEKTTLPVGMEVMAWVVLPFEDGTIEYLRLHAEVVRVSEVSNSNIQKASLKFLNVDNNSLQHIIRFCFETQLQHKKKGIVE